MNCSPRPRNVPADCDTALSFACVQCCSWLPHRLPGVFVGDNILGGRSTTMAAHDCLQGRSYNIPAITLTDISAKSGKASICVCVQCDLWRALRLPGILVGDSKLGGISTTIAAHDCLRMRGYDIPAIVLTDTGLQNWKYLRESMSDDALVLSVPECPPAPASRSDCSAPVTHPTFITHD